jgi:hypothetical protein
VQAVGSEAFSESLGLRISVGVSCRAKLPSPWRVMRNRLCQSDYQAQRWEEKGTRLSPGTRRMARLGSLAALAIWLGWASASEVEGGMVECVVHDNNLQVIS